MSEGGVGDTEQQQQDRWCLKYLWKIIHMIFTCCGLPFLIYGFIVGTNNDDNPSEEEGGSLTEKLIPPESSVRKAEPEGRSAPPYHVSEQQPSGEEFLEMEIGHDKKQHLPSVAEEEEANAGGRGSMLTVPLGNDNDDDEKYFSPKSDDDDDNDNDNSSDDENYLSPKSDDFEPMDETMSCEGLWWSDAQQQSEGGMLMGLSRAHHPSDGTEDITSDNTKRTT